ncbi:hypothetical protein niasHT_002572 [Heterodera trifolii]|uniref:Ubiquitin-like domain-containing protein n=1 Tax=Heterodera trifolii TaxID=157864 RepID=A0ABD2LVT6_9BILA
MKMHFGFSLFSVGISAVLIIMLVLLMILPQSIADDYFAIHVKRPIGYTITQSVVLKKTDSVATLKKEIIKAFNIIPPIKLTLTHNNPYATPLDSDYKTMKYYSIEEGVIFYYFLGDEKITIPEGEFEVFVKNGEKKYSIKVKITDTVAILKVKVQKATGIPAEIQTFAHYPVRGRVFDDDNKTMKDCGILVGATVLMVFPFEIAVCCAGKMYSVEVKETDTVATVKEKIAKMIDIPPKRQLMSTQKSDVLEDKKTMDSYGIVKGKTVDVCWNEFEIYVQNGEEVLTVKVQAIDTVATVKEKIQKNTGILTEKQILRPKHSRALKKDNYRYGEINPNAILALGDNNKTMKDYGIEKGATLYLEMPFEILINFADKMHTVEVQATLTVREFKERIKNMIDIGGEQQNLALEPDGRELWNIHTMDHCGIKKGSKVFLSLGFLQKIYYACESYCVRLKSTDTVKSLKDQLSPLLERELGYKFGQMRLCKYNGPYFSDDKTVGECGIDGSDDIYVR